MYRRAILAAALAAAILPPSLAGQEWRNLNASRQVSTEERLDVQVKYGVGRLRIEPGRPGELYRVGLRYDAELFEPVAEYRSGRLTVGVEGTGKSMRMRNQEAGEMKLTVTPDIPVSMALSFGAVEADMELGGLRIARVRVETGASDSRLRFSRPNPGECETLDLSMGAAAFRATGLANANCARIKAQGGVGDMNLDFTGDWRRDVTADISMALGAVTLVVPEDIGVVVRRSTFLTSFSGAGFNREGRDHFSDNWAQASHKLTVELQGAFGSVSVRRPETSATMPTP